MRYTLILCVLLTGCATVYDLKWARADGTGEALFREKAQCTVDTAGYGLQTPYLFTQCMNGKGWREVK